MSADFTAATRHALLGGPLTAARRARELEHEAETEAAQTANLLAIAAVGGGLASVLGPRYLVLPAAVGGYLLWRTFGQKNPRPAELAALKQAMHPVVREAAGTTDAQKLATRTMTSGVR